MHQGQKEFIQNGENKRTPSVLEGGQDRGTGAGLGWAGLGGADRKARVARISTLYTSGVQKSISAALLWVKVDTPHPNLHLHTSTFKP